MARVWVKGGGTPVFRVSRAGYDAANPATPAAGISFDAVRAGNGTLYMAGHVTEASVAAAGGLICSFPDFGYIPQTRVLARAGYSDGEITNVLIDTVFSFSTGVSRFQIVSGPTQKVTDWYYFVFTARQL